MAPLRFDCVRHKESPARATILRRRRPLTVAQERKQMDSRGLLVISPSEYLNDIASLKPAKQVQWREALEDATHYPVREDTPYHLLPDPLTTTPPYHLLPGLGNSQLGSTRALNSKRCRTQPLKAVAHGLKRL